MNDSSFNGTVTHRCLDDDGTPFDEQLEVCVFQDGRPIGRRFSVCITKMSRGNSDSFTDLSARNARILGELLLGAAEMAEALEGDGEGVRSLPTITLCGAEFFIDEKLRQLRSVQSPHHFFDLNGQKKH
jgi:hypothetical protein